VIASENEGVTGGEGFGCFLGTRIDLERVGVSKARRTLPEPYGREDPVGGPEDQILREMNNSLSTGEIVGDLAENAAH
jgi:hypothetical protein